MVEVRAEHRFSNTTGKGTTAKNYIHPHPPPWKYPSSGWVVYKEGGQKLPAAEGGGASKYTCTVLPGKNPSGQKWGREGHAKITDRQTNPKVFAKLPIWLLVNLTSGFCLSAQGAQLQSQRFQIAVTSRNSKSQSAPQNPSRITPLILLKRSVEVATGSDFKSLRFRIACGLDLKSLLIWAPKVFLCNSTFEIFSRACFLQLCLRLVR